MYKYSGRKGEDYFNRSVVAGKILQLVEAGDETLTVCIDGEWGEGKTFFADVLRECFEENSYNVIYFDAYKSDYQDDPLTALLAEVASLSGEEKKQHITKRLSQLAAPFLSTGMKVAVKAATSGVLDANTCGEIVVSALQSAGNEASSLLSSYVRESIELYNKREESLESLRGVIEECAISDGKKGLLFIVDELDRCRPSYSVEVIEKIKHVFQAKNTDFVLVMNKSQMKKTISHTYGEIDDVDNYLEKFLTHSVALPKRKIGDSHLEPKNKASYIYAYRLAKERLKGLSCDIDGSAALLAFLCEKKDFNLRKIDRIVSSLSLNLLLHRDEYSREDVELSRPIEWPDFFFIVSAVAVEVGANISPKAKQSQGDRKIHKVMSEVVNSNGTHVSGLTVKREQIEAYGIKDSLSAFVALNEDFGQDVKGILDTRLVNVDEGAECLYEKFFDIYQKSKSISL